MGGAGGWGAVTCCYNDTAGPVAQRLVQGTHPKRCLRGETREVDGKNSGKPSGAAYGEAFARTATMATLSRAGGAPPEGAETT